MVWPFADSTSQHHLASGASANFHNHKDHKGQCLAARNVHGWAEPGIIVREPHMTDGDAAATTPTTPEARPR